VLGITHGMWHDAAIMMARTQITLTPEALRRARARAAEMRISLAEYLRRLIARDLGDELAPVDVTSLFDLGSSGGTDVARDKNRLVGEAVEKGRSRRHHG
jgi:hypothetical protein